MIRFDCVYQAVLLIIDIFGVEPTEQQQRRELDDVLSALEHDAYQHGFADGREYQIP